MLLHLIYTSKRMHLDATCSRSCFTSTKPISVGSSYCQSSIAYIRRPRRIVADTADEYSIFTFHKHSQVTMHFTKGTGQMCICNSSERVQSASESTRQYTVPTAKQRRTALHYGRQTSGELYQGNIACKLTGPLTTLADASYRPFWSASLPR